MARVIERAPITSEVARHRHTCGALVEFTRADIQGDQRDGDYVVCPACNTTPWISVKVLAWIKKVEPRKGCPRCGSTDIIDASQSLDCHQCGHSW